MVQATTNMPTIQKAVKVIYDMSEDTKIREIARLREKALHDEASALKQARISDRVNLKESWANARCIESLIFLHLMMN